MCPPIRRADTQVGPYIECDVEMKEPSPSCRRTLTTPVRRCNPGADCLTRGFMKYQCISADSHLEIRPDRYAKRVPEKFRDRAPKVITLEDGSLAVLQEGQPLERLISNISCGLPYEERRPFDPLPGENYESSPGTGSPEQRLREQDKDGVDAEVLFPGNVGPGFWRGIRNDEAISPWCAPTTIGSPRNIAPFPLSA